MKKLVLWAVAVPLIVASMAMFSFETSGVQHVASVATPTAQ